MSFRTTDNQFAALLLYSGYDILAANRAGEYVTEFDFACTPEQAEELKRDFDSDNICVYAKTLLDCLRTVNYCVREARRNGVYVN
jgi:hypothetical protein